MTWGRPFRRPRMPASAWQAGGSPLSAFLPGARGRWPHHRARRQSLIAWSPLATGLVARRSADRSDVRPGELSVRVERSHRVLVLSVRGKIDLVSVPQLEEELRKAEASDAKLVVLDLADVEFMDSSGLHALLRAWQRFEQNRDPLALSRVSPQVRRLLELTGTDRIFGVEGRR